MSKCYTRFGEWFSAYRKEIGETIVEAAKKMGVSIAYISSVEHGDREIPLGWKKKIAEVYALNDKQVKDLEESIKNTPSNKKITIQEIENCMNNYIQNVFEGADKENALKIKDRLILELKLNNGRENNI